MKSTLLLVLASSLVSCAAHAQVPPVAPMELDPAQQALGQIAQEGQQREATALFQVFSLKNQLNKTKSQLEIETKRANDLDFKLRELQTRPAETNNGK